MIDVGQSGHSFKKGSSTEKMRRFSRIVGEVKEIAEEGGRIRSREYGENEMCILTVEVEKGSSQGKDIERKESGREGTEEEKSLCRPGHPRREVWGFGGKKTGAS